jgi:hypothetical protein
MQERKNYAKGSTLESTTGYVVKVGMPVVDDTVKATSNGATFTENAPLTDGQYLVTLEVNGEAVAYKESVTADSGITVGDYSVAENAGKIVLTGASANDIVRLLIEPLEVYVSDGFRAAINKAVPKSEGGGSGGGVLVVTDTDGVLDKTWQEIHDAFVAGSVRIQNGTDTNTLTIVRGVQYHSKSGEYRVEPASAGSWQLEIYVASSADGYPTL